MTGHVFGSSAADGRWPEAEIERLVAEAEPAVFWMDRPDRPAAVTEPPAEGEADLVVVGGGFTGLWAAVQAAEQDPGRRVVVVEAGRIGAGASGRNGGFCDASLTHGLINGIAHWPDEIETLVRLGRANWRGLLDDCRRLGVDAGAEAVDLLDVAVAQWQLDELAEDLPTLRRFGLDAELLDADAVTARLRSPLYRGGLVLRGKLALVDPARLAWGLAAAARRLGVTVMEGAEVEAVEADGPGVRLRIVAGRVDARALTADRVIVATNAWAQPVRAMRRRIVPVYDHALVTEPLSAERRAAVGWAGREGVADVGNQFHYYRLTADDRILWGGYDANYHRGGEVRPEHEERPASDRLLVRHFLETFPQLEGVRLTHRWAGPIGTTTRFSATWGTALAGRVVWVGGYTGLGVAASRFGARVALDLVDGRSTERTELAMVRRPPFPFPPEPLRSVGIALTRRALARADRRQGRRGAWLRLLDRFGVGYDS